MEAKLKLYDVKTLSELWGVAETTIYQLVHSGKLQAIRIGRGLRFREQDLEVFLDQNQESNKPKMNKHIYLRGITDNNDLTDDDFEEAKKIWAVTE
jgi:excisionase family DNA binding protein